MSTLNIALQCIGFMMIEMPEDNEKAISSCGNMDQLRSAGEKVSGLQWKWVIAFLVFRYYTTCLPRYSGRVTSLMHFLQQVVTSSRNFGKQSSTLMPLLRVRVAVSQKKQSPQLNFISHCCQQRHYLVTIKKYFMETCSITLPPECTLSTGSCFG